MAVPEKNTKSRLIIETVCLVVVIMSALPRGGHCNDGDIPDLQGVSDGFYKKEVLDYLRNCHSRDAKGFSMLIQELVHFGLDPASDALGFATISSYSVKVVTRNKHAF
ncbi:unnamed protein product [Lepeophtheirus salmonis]|uniref:(salmon louse) hypothetical protein n=1 Tax=Lepeophtheirus salmonis TaxID=72036 RepID=A0A7R8HC38_LEPSM|nr:unnamed protein product [Lepeophtheirus salmonis]CAF3000572.1 unnamed protein product [Lepeophtheirus salmonis]